MDQAEAKKIFWVWRQSKILFIPYLPLFKTGVPQIWARKDAVYANITTIFLKTFIPSDFDKSQKNIRGIDLIKLKVQ